MDRRRFFAHALACMALMAALATFSPLRFYDPVVAVHEASYRISLSDIAAEPVHVAFAAEEQRHDARSPAADAHAVAYEIDNQPGAVWRVAVDTTFALIDPHIRGA